MHSVGGVMVHRAAGRGQQMSERRGGMKGLKISKREKNKDMTYRAKNWIHQVNKQVILNLCKQIAMR